MLDSANWDSIYSSQSLDAEMSSTEFVDITLDTFNICFKLKQFTVRPAFSNKNSLRNQKINWYKDDLKYMKSRLMMFYYLYKDSLFKHVKVMYQDLKSKYRQVLRMQRNCTVLITLLAHQINAK